MIERRPLGYGSSNANVIITCSFERIQFLHWTISPQEFNLKDLFDNIRYVQRCHGITYQSIHRCFGEFIKSPPSIGSTLSRPDGTVDRSVVVVDAFHAEHKICTKVRNLPLIGKSLPRCTDCQSIFNYARRSEKHWIVSRESDSKQLAVEQEKVTALEKEQKEHECPKLKFADRRVVQELQKCLENDRLGDSEEFHAEQFHIKNLKSAQHLKWLNNPDSFAFFLDALSYGSLGAYDVLYGETPWKDGQFSGVLAAPSVKAIRNLLNLYTYAPGLSEVPLEIVCHCLSALKFVRCSGTWVGDEMFCNKGMNFVSLDKDPFWFGRTAIDHTGNMENVVLREIDERIISMRVEDVNDPRIPKYVMASNHIRALLSCNNEPEIGGRVVQMYLNIDGVRNVGTEDEPKYENMSLKFPMFWMITPVLNAEKSHGMILASIIFAQKYFNEHCTREVTCFGVKSTVKIPLDINSLTWDGESGIQGMVKRYGSCSMESADEGIKHLLFIPVVDTLVSFTNDAGHLLKEVRNESFRISQKSEHDNPKVVEALSGEVLLPAPLWKVLTRLVAIEKSEKALKLTKLTEQHIRLSDRSKMNQRLANEIFTLQTMKGIFSHFLAAGEDEFTEETAREIFKWKGKKKNLRDAQGIKAAEAKGAIAYIYMLYRSNKIFKSNYVIKDKNDLRLTQADEFITKLVTYKNKIIEKYSTTRDKGTGTLKIDKESKLHMLKADTLEKLISNCYSFKWIANQRITKNIPTKPSSFMSQDVVET